MLEQSILREQSERLLNSAQQAVGTYLVLARTQSDPRLREQLQRLCRDKQRHVRLAERLLEIVS
jgi:rubrerythrin